jgi:hypothetical protein
MPSHLLLGGSCFSSRSLMQDRNAFDTSRLPAILTDQRGSLPLGRVMVIFSEAAKSSSKALATAAVLFRLATALNQPVNTVADGQDRETGASDRPRRAPYIPTLAIAILVITSLVISGLGQIRDTKYRSPRQRKQDRN